MYCLRAVVTSLTGFSGYRVFDIATNITSLRDYIGGIILIFFSSVVMAKRTDASQT
jgi:hypothetical protein